MNYKEISKEAFCLGLRFYGIVLIFQALKFIHDFVTSLIQHFSVDTLLHYFYMTNPMYEGQQDYIKMTTEQVNVTFSKNEAFLSKATAGSRLPFNYAHMDGWVSVKISRLQPKNKIGFLRNVWSSKLK